MVEMVKIRRPIDVWEITKRRYDHYGHVWIDQFFPTMQLGPCPPEFPSAIPASVSGPLNINLPWRLEHRSCYWSLFKP